MSLAIALVGPGRHIKGRLRSALCRDGFTWKRYRSLRARPELAGEACVVVPDDYESLLVELFAAGCIIVWCNAPNRLKGETLSARKGHPLLGKVHAHVVSLDDSVVEAFLFAVKNGELNTQPGATQRWFGVKQPKVPTFKHPRKG